MRELRVFPEAEAELAEAAEWYESKRAGLGVELVLMPSGDQVTGWDEPRVPDGVGGGS